MANGFCSFGWTNASIIYGLSLLDTHARRALGVCAPYESYARAASKAAQKSMKEVDTAHLND